MPLPFILCCALQGVTVAVEEKGAGEAAIFDPEPAHQFLFAAVFLLLGLLLIPAGRFLSSELLDAEREPRAAFLWTDLAATVLAFLLGQLLVGSAVHFFHPGLENLTELATVEALGLTAAGFALPAAYILFAARARPGGLAALGVRTLTPGYRLCFGGLLYVAGLPLFLGLGALSSALMNVLGEPVEQDVAVMIQNGIQDSPWMIVLFAVVVVPLLEEILFRGLLLELITSRFGRAAGVLGSSALFAVAHGAAAALPIFGLAIILAWVKLRTRSLAAAWFVHAIHNGGTTFLLWASTFF